MNLPDTIDTQNNLPVVALIGRPNVGKSTFFNRLSRSRDAIVDPTPGVTRDRHYAQIQWEDNYFELIDTGGLDDEQDELNMHIRNQALEAMDDADIILFLLDGRAGVMPGDHEIVDMLRRSNKTVFFAVNKVDSPEQEVTFLPPFYELGVERLWPISAEHNYGIRDLMQQVVADFPADTLEQKLPDNTVRLAFLGRPNVGKSSMINRLIGEERMVVSDIAGTTRDSVNTLLSRDQYSYLLMDTAGIRRKGKTTDKLEKFSILKSLAALARCEIAMVLIDAEEGITEQDTKVLGYTQEHSRGCIILLNKWDLIEKDKRRHKQLLEEVAMATSFIPFVPVLKVSAKTGRGIKKIFPEIGRIQRQFNERFATSDLNRLLEAATRHHEPPLHRGRRLKLYYTAQIKTAPPTFVVIANYPKAIHFSYQRYLTNRYREGLGLDRVPVKLIFKQKSRKKR